MPTAVQLAPISPANQFRPGEFLNALRTSSLPFVLKYTGLMKADDQNEQSLLFFLSTCRSWTRLDHDAIERIEYLGMAPCGDHEHAVVRIEIKQPLTPEGQAIARLADHTRPSAERVWAIETQDEFGLGACEACVKFCHRVSDPAARRMCLLSCVEGPCV